MINPALTKYHSECKIIGELILGYSELDLSFSYMCGIATGKRYELLNAVNKVRSEASRLDIADALAAPTFSSLGLKDEYASIKRSMLYCKDVRNQWAHSQWGDMEPYGLAFTRVDGDVFAQPTTPLKWLSVTTDLLEKQEAYFEHTRNCILVTESNLIPLLAGKKAVRKFPREIPQPSRHSPWTKQAHAHLNTMTQYPP